MKITEYGSAGIFGYISGATIKNLGVSGNISSDSYCIGGICGYNSNGTITNCFVTGNLSLSSSYNSSSFLGGMCGYNVGSIINCYNTGNLSLTSSNYLYLNLYSFGGICGRNDGTVTNCYNTGKSEFPSFYSLGGICGINTENIINCYNTGNISSSNCAGGICGINTGNIINCYNTGNISSSNYTGGICGDNGTITNCFAANAQITNVNDAPKNYIGRIGGNYGSYQNCYALDVMKVNGDPISSSSADNKNGKDTDISFFKSKEWLQNNLLWSFYEAWCMMEGYDYPVLKIQFPEYKNSVITFGTIPEVTYGDQLILSATSNNQTADIVYQSSDNTIAEVTGNKLITKKVGTVTVTASQPQGNNYWAGMATIDIAVGKKELTVTANSPSIAYGDALPVYTCRYTGFVNNETESVLKQTPYLICAANSQSNAGSYVITPVRAEADNYTFTYQTGTLTIQKRSLRVTPANASRMYGDTNPAFTLSYEGFVNGNTLADIATQPTASTTAASSSNAGEYDITCSGGNATNYSFTYQTGKLQITKAPLSVSVSNASRNYGSDNPAFNLTYSGFRNSETQTALSALPQAACTASAASGAGTYPITVSGGAALNYDFSYVSGTLTVNKAGVTVTANAVSSVYGDEIPPYTCRYSGFANNETESVLTKLPAFSCSATSQSNVGQYTVTPAGAEAQNYTFVYETGTLTITKAPLIITANNASRPQGEANPSFSLIYSGFKNSETESVLDQLPGVSCAATPDSPVGFYDIVLSGGMDHNYEYQLINGKLEVTAGTGLVETEHAASLRVYPNPVKDYLHIQSDVPIEKVDILDIAGKKIIDC